MSKASNNFDHVATASAIPGNVMKMILDSITMTSYSRELYPFGVDDYALEVYKFLRDKGLTKDDLEQLIVSK